MIVLTTLNAGWIHSAFGLRYLAANLGELRDRCAILEFTTKRDVAEVAAEIASHRPTIVGIGVYVWNASESLALVKEVRRALPGAKIVLGGPEVSHETESQAIAALADHVVRGEGDLAFAELARTLYAGQAAPKVIDARPPAFAELVLPYELYTATDLAHRVIYVEASRGCPFRCEFCLSALDRGVRSVGPERLLPELRNLWDRGARRFKFVDRTFNLKVDEALPILEFFAARQDESLFVHFEMVPDRLPVQLRDILGAFQPGTLQLEIGIQTFDSATGARISRRQDIDKARENLRWLLEHTHAHLHVDLIAGLPGESVDSFFAGFDELVAIGPHEIQVGILKRLRGAPISRHDSEWEVEWDDAPPYALRSSRTWPAQRMAEVASFAAYWDKLANSGWFRQALPLVWRGEPPSSAFGRFARWLEAELGGPSGQGYESLSGALWRYLTQEVGVEAGVVGPCLLSDHRRGGRADVPGHLQPYSAREPTASSRRASLQSRQRRFGD